jgi:hypothetical protein
VEEQDMGFDIFVEEEIEWDLDDLIGPEPKFEVDDWQEALLKARKSTEKNLYICAQLAKDLEWKIKEKLKKVKIDERAKVEK